MHFINTITPDLRIQIPEDLVAFLKLKPGDTVNIQYQGFNRNRPTMSWTSLVDERFQTCIPDDVIKTHDIKPRNNISLWHDNPDVIYVKPGITWKDLNADNIAARFQYDKLTIDIRRETQHNDSVDYFVKLYGPENIQWERKLMHCERTDAKVNMDKLKELAIHAMRDEARTNVEAQAQLLSDLRSVAVLLENLSDP